METASKSILIVDDDAQLVEALERRLRGRDITALVATSAREALEALRSSPRPMVALIDVFLGADSGLDLASDLRAAVPGLPVILFTAHPSSDLVLRSARVGALGLLPKPVEVDQIFELLTLRAGAGTEPDSDSSLARNEWNFIQRVLHRCGSNISEAARRLGISRQTLQRKLRKNPPNR